VIYPLQRAQIVGLACLEPVAKGLHNTHWTSEDLARQAVAEGIVPAVSERTIRRILHDVDSPEDHRRSNSPPPPSTDLGRRGLCRSVTPLSPWIRYRL
jgi:hypothetical protein